MPEPADLRHAQCMKAAQALRELAYPKDGVLGGDPEPGKRELPAMVDTFEIDWKWQPGVTNLRHLADPDLSTFYLHFTNGTALRAPLSTVTFAVDPPRG